MGSKGENDMRMKRMVWATAVAGALAWSGMAQAQGAGQAQGQAGGQGQVTDRLRDALQKLHATNQAEIQLARAAQNQARSEEVKQFARRMVQEHQKGDRQLQDAAQRLGLQLQGDTYQETLQDLREKAQDLQQQKGAEFDRRFMRQMVDAHKDTLDDVHASATNAAEEGVPQLAQVLGQAEASLHQHHAMALQIQTKLQQQAQQTQGGTGAGAGGDAGTVGAPGASGAGGAMDQGEQQ
jgi:putative membrane protein